MPDEPRSDVLPESSPGSEGTPSVEPASSSSPDATPAGDRPLQNYFAELTRKYGNVERQIAELTSAVSSLAQQTQPRPQPDASRQYSDAELLAMARAGSDEAMTLYVQRQIAAQNAERDTTSREQTLVATQLQWLYRAYPMLQSDSQHPLTQASIQAKRLLMQYGRPNDHATDLEAIKSAIADFPHLAAEAREAPVTEPTRRAAVTPQQDIVGRTTRRESPRPAEAPSARSAELAARYGVKDPKKAKERFDDNQKRGRSSVSPTLSLLLREEGT